MCLLEVYSDQDMNRIVEELPEVAPNIIRLHKIVEAPQGIAWANYHQDCSFCCIYRSGINIARREHLSFPPRYWTGFHFYLKKFTIFPALEITCLLRPEWITAVGKDFGGVTFVASQAFFPTYPETEAKLEDFLAWLKENDKEYAEGQLCEMAVK